MWPCRAVSLPHTLAPLCPPAHHDDHDDHGDHDDHHEEGDYDDWHLWCMQHSRTMADAVNVPGRQGFIRIMQIFLSYHNCIFTYFHHDLILSLSLHHIIIFLSSHILSIFFIILYYVRCSLMPVCEWKVPTP